MSVFKSNVMIRKIFLSYFLLLIIPIILFSIFVFDFYNRYIVSNVRAEQTMLAEKTLNVISSDMLSINKVAEDMQKNRLFHTYFSKDMYVPFIDIKDYLSDAEGMMNLSIKIYYCDISGGKIYTSAGSSMIFSPVDDILEKCTYIKSRETVTEALKTSIVYPIEHTKMGTLMSAVVFTIDNEYFRSNLNYSAVYKGMASQVHYKDQLIYSVNEKNTNYNNERSYMHVSAQGDQGYRVDSYIPMDQVRGNHFYSVGFLALFVLAMSIFCTIIVYVTIKNNYLPWQKSIFILQDFFKITYATPKEIDDSIERLIRSAKDLEQKSKETMLEDALFRAMSERVLPDAKYVDIIKESLPGSLYVCVTLAAEDANRLNIKNNIPNFVVHMNHKITCVILCSGSHVLKDFIDEMPKISSECGINNIGIGTVADSLEQLRESYLSSKIAFNMSLKCQRLVVAEPIGESESSHYPYELFDELDSACANKNAERIKYLTGKLQSVILSSHNRFSACCIFQEYLKTVSCGLSSLKLDGFDPVSMRNGYYKSTGISVEAITDNMEAIAAKAEQLILESNNNVIPAVTAQTITDYIKKNFLSPNFSLKSMSFDLNISPSNASHIFKKETSITLTEYVDNLKIEYSKELLSKPDSSVNEVSAALNFANPSTFIKKFRAMEGITPGVYKASLSENN